MILSRRMAISEGERGAFWLIHALNGVSIRDD